MSKVEIYSTPTCTFCHYAKDFFNENNVAFTEYNVGTDLEKRQEMVEKSGQMGVPVIAVDGVITVGFDEAKLRELLKI
jgi:glutaredoxin-like YruB-family protein